MWPGEWWACSWKMQMHRSWDALQAARCCWLWRVEHRQATHSVVLSAFHRVTASTAVALLPTLCRLMKLHGVRMDESHANTLLRMCYNRLRQSWVPGGYPPHKAEAAGGAAGASLPGSRRTQERQRLLEVRGWAGNMPNCGLAKQLVWRLCRCGRQGVYGACIGRVCSAAVPAATPAVTCST